MYIAREKNPKINLPENTLAMENTEVGSEVGAGETGAVIG